VVRFFGKAPRVDRPDEGIGLASTPPREDPFPIEDVRKALEHVIDLVDRSARSDADAAWSQSVKRLALRVHRACTAIHWEELAADLQTIRLPKPEVAVEIETATKLAVTDAVDVSLPVARALGVEDADLGLARLRSEASAGPVADALHRFARELEQVAHGVGWLRGATGVFRTAISGLVELLERLGGHAPTSLARLRDVRAQISAAEDIHELDALRRVLLREAETLVDEAQARTELAEEAQLHARETQAQVQVLERALHDVSTMARTDPLTGLGNRRALEVVVAKHARTGANVGVLALDLDHFKRVNDAYGHDGGDRALRAVADRVKNELRGDDEAFRVGGEELFVLLAGVDLAGAAKTAERLRDRVARQPVGLDRGRELAVTVSIGVALWGPGEDFASAVRAADEALYFAKEAGRNRVEVAR
jgi:diguanylate cyclase (GGDEF)-like protein